MREGNENHKWTTFSYQVVISVGTCTTNSHLTMRGSPGEKENWPKKYQACKGSVVPYSKWHLDSCFTLGHGGVVHMQVTPGKVRVKY